MTSRTVQPVPVSRRTVLAGLAAAATACAAGPAAAPSKALLSVPTVDGLSVQVVVDAATFGPFLPDLELPGLKVERTVRVASAGPAVMSKKPLIAEFGLCLWARSQKGDASRTVLVDFAYTPGAVANNLELLGLDPSEIDASMLSHGHLDHYGGFAGALGNPGDRQVPLIVGGEEVFCERLAMLGPSAGSGTLMGALDRDALRRAGFDVQIRAEPALLAEHAFTTGTIPLASAERAAIPTQMLPGTGCELAGLAPGKRGFPMLPDDGEHELAACYLVRGLGLVVIVSCGHRGVLNSVRRAQEVSGVSQIHAVMGGFHLVRPRTPEEAKETAALMAKLDPAWIVPMHCTGEDFTAEAERLMPGRVIRPYVGNRLTFAA